MTLVGLFVNVHEEERAGIKKAAGDAGLSMADYVVECCLGRPAQPRGAYAELARRVADLEAAASTAKDEGC